MYDNAEGDTPQEKINSLRRNIAFAKKHDTMISGGRITDPLSSDVREWAQDYYKEILKKSTDAKKIANRLGIHQKDIEKIKQYLCNDKKFWNSITEQIEEFQPDAAIAQS